MIKLKTESLRTFQAKASKIERDTLLPVLTNLKIELANGLCLITKANISGGAVVIGQVVHDAESAPGAYLVDERTLWAIIWNTREEFVIIDSTDQLTLVDGKSITTMPIQPVEHFPQMPDYAEAEIFKFLPQHIKAIKIASQFTNNQETAGNFQFVHIKGEDIFGLHPQFFYINGSFTNLPTVALRKDEVDVITEHDEIEFMDTNNHHVLFSPGFTYIFTKGESAATNIKPWIKRLRTGGKDFNCNLSDIVNFCNRANGITENPVATCTLTQGVLKMNDANYSRAVTSEFMCLGQPDEFTFNSRLLVSPLKSVPYDQVKAKTNSNCLIVNEGEEWFCFIGMAKN